LHRIMFPLNLDASSTSNNDPLENYFYI